MRNFVNFLQITLLNPLINLYGKDFLSKNLLAIYLMESVGSPLENGFGEFVQTDGRGICNFRSTALIHY